MDSVQGHDNCQWRFGHIRLFLDFDGIYHRACQLHCWAQAIKHRVCGTDGKLSSERKIWRYPFNRCAGHFFWWFFNHFGKIGAKKPVAIDGTQALFLQRITFENVKAHL